MNGWGRPGALRAAWGLLLVVLVVLSSLAGPGRVLCIGEDGHVGVELSGGACCDSTAPAGGDAHGTPDDCGDCTDLEASDPFAAPGRAPSVPEPARVALPASLAWDDLCGTLLSPPAASEVPRPREPGPPRGTLRDLRGIRLRC